MHWENTPATSAVAAAEDSRSAEQVFELDGLSRISTTFDPTAPDNNTADCFITDLCNNPTQQHSTKSNLMLSPLQMNTISAPHSASTTTTTTTSIPTPGSIKGLTIKTSEGLQPLDTAFSYLFSSPATRSPHFTSPGNSSFFSPSSLTTPQYFNSRNGYGRNGYESTMKTERHKRNICNSLASPGLCMTPSFLKTPTVLTPPSVLSTPAGLYSPPLYIDTPNSSLLDTPTPPIFSNTPFAFSGAKVPPTPGSSNSSQQRTQFKSNRLGLDGPSPYLDNSQNASGSTTKQVSSAKDSRTQTARAYVSPTSHKASTKKQLPTAVQRTPEPIPQDLGSSPRADTRNEICLSTTTLRLVPCDDKLRALMESNGYNPHLELVIRPQKRIANVVKHLQTKWQRVSSKFPNSIRILPLNAPLHEPGWDANDKRMTCLQMFRNVEEGVILLRYTWTPLPTSVPWGTAESAGDKSTVPKANMVAVRREGKQNCKPTGSQHGLGEKSPMPVPVGRGGNQNSKPTGIKQETGQEFVFPKANTVAVRQERKQNGQTTGIKHRAGEEFVVPKANMVAVRREGKPGTLLNNSQFQVPGIDSTRINKHSTNDASNKSKSYVRKPKRERPLRKNAPTLPTRGPFSQKRKVSDDSNFINGYAISPSPAIKRFRMGANVVSAPRSPSALLDGIGFGTGGVSVGTSAIDELQHLSAETLDEWADVELSLSQLLDGGAHSLGLNNSSPIGLNNSHASNVNGFAGMTSGLSNLPPGLDCGGNSINMLGDF